MFLAFFFNSVNHRVFLPCPPDPMADMTLLQVVCKDPPRVSSCVVLGKDQQHDNASDAHSYLFAVGGEVGL